MDKQEIINLEQYADALRSTGYKNIESAVSEIVDNSLEAEASDVFIIVKSKSHEVTGYKHVYEIAFLDNGHGMDKELVQSCLRIGYGTRSSRSGMGRFGVGLPQASMHACPLVEVYSWQKDSEVCYKSFLDVEKLRSGDQKYFDEPEAATIPEEYEKFLKCTMFDKTFNFSESGTLVIWRNCDNVSPKTVNPLFNRLEFSLGQKFRYWIYNNQRNIYLVDMDNYLNNLSVLPNDPLLLMDKNYALGNPEKPTTFEKRNPYFYDPIFEPYTNENNKTGIVTLPVKYIDNSTQTVKESNITIKFSIVKKDYYDLDAVPRGKNPGSYVLGKHASKLEGISIVRADREIDFGRFDFYDVTNEPVHRWWGCEINFDPELDEAFGVSNNKQHVELIELDPEDYENDEAKPVWFQLKSLIQETIKAMCSRNAAIRLGSGTIRSGAKVTKTSEQTINELESHNPTPTESEVIRKEKSVEELQQAAKETLEEQGIENPTDDEIQELLLNKVNILYKSNNRAPFFDYETSLGICKCVINIDHIFYKKFMTHIENDDEAKVAFELFIASLIRSRDEILDDRKKANFDDVIDYWNTKLTSYIKGLDS